MSQVDVQVVDGVQVMRHGDVEIRIIRSKCTSAGTCTVYAPQTFDLDAEGIAVIREGEWDRFEKIVAAAVSCPVFAIEVYQAGQRVYPKPEP